MDEIIKFNSSEQAHKSIKRCNDQFVECGLALMYMKKTKGYKDFGYKSFTAYVETECEYSLSTAKDYMTTGNVNKTGSMLPETKSIRQSKELAKIPDEFKADVIDEAESIAESTGKKVTAKVIKQAADKVMGVDVDDDLTIAQNNLKELQRQVRAASTYAKQIMKYDDKVPTAAYCRGISWHFAVLTLNDYVRALGDLMPVGGTPDKPQIRRQVRNK